MDERGEARNKSLLELAGLFLKLGSTAFGGPAAHIAMMEDEVVRRRKWLSHEEFLDLLGATNLIPGPNSTEMAIHIGHRRAGWAGWLVAGLSFIFPAMLIVMCISWVYVRYGKLPQVEGILYGIKPMIIAIVLQALWKLGRGAVKTKTLAILALVAVVLNFAGVNELLLLFGAGVFMIFARAIGQRWMKTLPCFVPLLGTLPATPIVAAVVSVTATPFSLWALFLFFVKIGSVLFGSGYVLLAFLRSEFVERLQWLTETQLLDAVAVGQMVPGPVFTTATFIGYILGGPLAALIATAGIFLPAFFFVAISGPLIPRLRRSPTAGAFLDGVNVAALALMLVVTLQLGKAALVDGLTIFLAVIGAFLLLRYKVNSAWLVLGGAALGLGITFLF